MLSLSHVHVSLLLDELKGPGYVKTFWLNHVVSSVDTEGSNGRGAADRSHVL